MSDKLYTPQRGGHAPDGLRQTFLHALDDFMLFDELELEDGRCENISYRGRSISMRCLTGLLWNCTDIMPGSTCRQLYELAMQVTDDDEYRWRGGQTYAQGARLVRLYIDR